jgi:Highly conserved protein containing a thioredoxin domain
MNENLTELNTNRLINEKSPYLLQHAHNPVDWYPWGDEAFAKAGRENKPIFLSIGYSTCHWCHVMERESFENNEVADLLNEKFVAIKVDREERPDIDHIYMQVCQTLTGSGGWPLTIIMTPEHQPFYAATYLPPKSRGGMMGLVELLGRLSDLWENDQEKALQAGRDISSWVQRSSGFNGGQLLAKAIFSQAYQQYTQMFDRTYGGFGSAPKFPTPHALVFLLKYHEQNPGSKALDMVEKTLTSMYQGGIYDHIGFGFARYSTDRKWLVPHFEKMLYDNALLAIAYLEAFRLTGKELYSQVAEDIFTYVMRDMQSPLGGFYSAEDADSEGEEGKYYTWSLSEVMDALGSDGSSFCEAYDIAPAGNFEGRSIPNLIHNSRAMETRNQFAAERQVLLELREQRVKPLRDDKILTAWNGLMIAALAMGARIMKQQKYQEAAQKAADFILGNLRREDGRLLARYREGEALYPAYASDYAYLVWGLTELHESGAGGRYLQTALELNNDLLRLFWDEQEGGLFFYGADSEQLLTRPKEVFDGALPSDNAVATFNFLRLAKIARESELAAKARQQFQHFAGAINENPTAYSFWLQAALLQQNMGQKIVLA